MVYRAFVVPRTAMTWTSLEALDLDSLGDRKKPMLIMFQTTMFAPDYRILETPLFRKFAYDSSLELRFANIGWEWDPPTNGTVALCDRIETQYHIDDYSHALPSFVICVPGSDELHIGSVSHTIEELIDIIKNDGKGIVRPQFLPEPESADSDELDRGR